MQARAAAGATVYSHRANGTSGRAIRDEPAGDDRGDRGARRRRPAAAASPSRSTTSCRTRSARWSTRIEREQGGLHILVNDIWGATTMEWNKTVWESDLEYGLRTLRLAVDTHAITSHFALPLLIKTPGGLVVEVTDGTDEYNATNYRVSFFYDLAKAA